LITAFALTLASVPVSTADDLGTLRQDLAQGGDFRVRVGAALALGKTHSRAAREPLEGALEDVHPAVRAAAAAALGALGQREALDALRSRLSREPEATVRSQIDTSIALLQAGRPGDHKARVLLKLGQLKNLSGVRGDKLAEVFRGATRAKAAELPGVEVVGDGPDAAREAESRKLPMVVLDGVVNRLAQGAQGDQVSVSAQVEYAIRKMPEHALTGTVSGAAKALDSARALQDQNRVTQLENQAVQGAVESALRGAPQVMRMAIR